MKKVLKGVILLAPFVIVMATSVQANQTGEYAVSPVLPHNQTVGVEHFFDIGWSPAESDQLGVRITNKTKTATTYQLQLNKARTNRNGVIDYADATPEASDTLYRLNELVKLPSSITIAGESSRVVTANIQFGTSDFNGILMGGIHVTKRADAELEGVSHTVSYNLPLIIRGNIDQRPEPRLVLTQLAVTPSEKKQFTLNVSLHNERANFLKEVYFEAVIKNNLGAVVDKQSSTWDLTPETELHYPVKLTGRYQQGIYQLELTVTHRSEQKWHFNETFELTAAKANQLKQKTTGRANAWISVILAGVILLSYFISKYVRRQFAKQKV